MGNFPETVFVLADILLDATAINSFDRRNVSLIWRSTYIST
jgi:hypothetical protein